MTKQLLHLMIGGELKDPNAYQRQYRRLVPHTGDSDEQPPGGDCYIDGKRRARRGGR